MDPPSNIANMSFSLSGAVISEYEFIYAISVFTTRPHILNRAIKGAELITEGEMAPKFFTHAPADDEFEEIEVPLDILDLLKEPYLKGTVDELRDLGVHRFHLQRILIGHTLKEYVSKETWDLATNTVLIQSDGEANKELPPFKIAAWLNKSSMDEYLMHFEVEAGSHIQSNSKLIQQSLNYYREKVMPKILKWAASVNNHDSTKAPGVPSTSLKFVPVKMYYELYKELKDNYFSLLQSVWTETTDPIKFISEEIGIAAYINCYVACATESNYSFVDMGCGNGVLTFALAACGASGFGFDIRPRKLWDVFPQLGIYPDLRVQSFNPFCDSITPQHNLWLIGNHADELTPWISVLAKKFSATGFIVIPCCLFDFHGKFQRRAKNSCDAQSLYQNYIHYIAEVGRKCGYSIQIDKLRIPSTKRVCIIGTILKPDSPENIQLLAEADAYVASKFCDYPSTDESIRDISLFKPRDPVEKINNLTQLDRSISAAIVQRIFNNILASRVETNHPEYLKVWNSGRIDLSLREASSLLTREEKDAIQKQGKGLQTLMKNHNQIFRISNGCVTLRRPILDDHVSGKKGERKIKAYPCYFSEYHPDGCPLGEGICTFSHSQSQLGP